MRKISGKLNLRVPNLGHLRQRPFEILSKSVAHGIKLQPDPFYPTLRSSPAHPAHHHRRRHASDKCPAIHDSLLSGTSNKILSFRAENFDSLRESKFVVEEPAFRRPRLSALRQQLLPHV